MVEAWVLDAGHAYGPLGYVIATSAVLTVLASLGYVSHRLLREELAFAEAVNDFAGAVHVRRECGIDKDWDVLRVNVPTNILYSRPAVFVSERLPRHGAGCHTVMTMSKSRRRHLRKWARDLLASGRAAVVLITAAGLAAVPDVTSGFSTRPTGLQILLLLVFAALLTAFATLSARAFNANVQKKP